MNTGAADIAGRATAGFTTWGFSLFAVLVVAAAWTVGASYRRSVLLRAVVGGSSSFAAAALGRVVKRAVAEPRPCQLDPSRARWSRCPTDLSFPSNHSVYAGAVGITVVLLGRMAHRTWIAVTGAVLAAAIGASRVVLGVHYWWDVVAGLTLGAATAAFALLLLVLLLRRRPSGPWSRPTIADRSPER